MSEESSGSRMDTSDQEQSMHLSQSSIENGARKNIEEHSISMPFSQTSTESGPKTETYENNWLTWNHALDIKKIHDGYFVSIYTILLISFYYIISVYCGLSFFNQKAMIFCFLVNFVAYITLSISNTFKNKKCYT